ncbi:MAG: menaquinone biosynthesis protein [Chloroflexi bacterium]|nr:menaquinone biosynthesis protein [Chloroflexota bacterium]
MTTEHGDLRVGLMPYLNSEVFYYDFESAGMELVPMVPSEMGQAADRGELDAGPIPLVDCFRLEDRFEYANGFCIATVERAWSILLYCRRPIGELSGASIAVTGETSTSAQLLRVLLTHRFEVRPREYVTLEQPHDAYLLIGDNALRRKGGDPSYPFLYDLGQVWYDWTGLPFVFARWIVRKTVASDIWRRLRDQLETSIQAGLANVEAIADKRHADLGLSRQEVMEYVRSFRYVAGEEETEAMGRFRHLLEALPQTSAVTANTER